MSEKPESHVAPAGGQRGRSWLAERLSLETFRYPVPAHANGFFYTLGGITLVGVGILIVTGILLAQFYTPVPEAANASVRGIITRPFLGNVLRGVHYWAAQVVMATLILHLGRVFFTGAYRRPREANWIIGILLLAVMGILYFTGTVLKWDQEAYEALEHMVAAAGLTGPLGFFFAPGFGNGQPLLTRVASLHFSVLPLLLLVLIGGHAFLIKKLGISPLPWDKPAAPGGMLPHTFDRHVKKLTGYGYALLGLVLLLSVLRPPALGPAPVPGIEVTRPPWLFMWIYSIENWFQVQGLVVTTLLLGLFGLLVPFLDRGPSAALKHRRPILVAGGLLALAIIALVVNAYVAPAASHLGM